ncbi:hypothetical protein EMCRGX_G008876 [Ephydatia muelleri]
MALPYIREQVDSLYSTHQESIVLKESATAKLQLMSTERVTHLCQNEVDIPWIEIYSIVQSTLSFLVVAIVCAKYDHPAEIPH